MPSNEINTLKLARELGVKPSVIVKEVEKIRQVEFKKNTTNVKLTKDEAETIRSLFSKIQEETPTDTSEISTEDKVEVPIKEEAPVETQKEDLLRKEGLATEETGSAITESEEKQLDTPQESLKESIETQEKEIISSEDLVDEIVIPDRFKKEIEVQKVEKIKPSMQKAFQAIKKIEPKKWLENKNLKKPKDKAFKKTEQPPQIQFTAPRKKSIKLHEGATVKDFAELLGIKVADVIKKFMELGYMATINQPIDMDVAVLVADSYGIKVEPVTPENIDILDEEEEREENLVPRPPVVTIMGHVDHGKTSLLDAIRKTKVTETEAGGITQHIGAYKVSLQGREITFLDTPGHEAFTALRARGAKVTDIVVLVVAADDGVMPQTIEAINHAKAANVPIVVAVNKIDKENANPAKVRNELAEHGVVSEEWGGQNIFVEVSAKKRIGIENLLEMILLQAEVMELKANPNRLAKGTIIEAKLDKGRGPVATVLIEKGTLRNGDAFVAGTTSGKVRFLIDDTGKRISEAGPSTPVEVIGFSEVPNAGDVFICVEDERKARQIALARQQRQRLAEVVRHKKLTLDELYAKIKEGQIKELNIIIKADVQGSVEAIKEALERITHPEVKVKVIHASVGGINETDVNLAAASNAILIGFNVRPEPKAMVTAEKEGVDIRFYNVIYDAVDDVKKALEGLLEPTLKEKVIGRAEVRKTYNISWLGTVAGCYVLEGTIQRSSDGIRVIRDNIVVYQGKISSLKVLKDDVREVQKGHECGILIENFNDVKVGDILENFVIEKIMAKIS